jgi:hypothetical protein
MIIMFPYGIVIPDFGGNKVDLGPCLLRLLDTVHEKHENIQRDTTL